MENLIVTNNPVVARKNDHVLFLDVSAEEILIKVRDLVHQGYELINHPLPASLRMMFSPFRSIILGKNLGKVDYFCAEIIEDSIIKYKNHTDHRKQDHVNGDDYKLMDLLLLESSLKEQTVTW